MRIFLLLLIGYLLGSFPTGYLLGRLKGIDIRQQGSGNIGATNVWRSLGPLAALLALLGDAGKGALAVVVGRWLAGPGAGDPGALLGGLAAIIGHGWSVFLRLQGGKMIATGLGVMLAVDPRVAGLGVAVWALVLALGRYVSLASIVAACSVPVWFLVLGRGGWYVAFGVALACLTTYKHRSNIGRLLRGEEFRVGARRKIN